MKVPSTPIKNKKVNEANLITADGEFHLTNEDLAQSYTGWDDFSVRVVPYPNQYINVDDLDNSCVINTIGFLDNFGN